MLWPWPLTSWYQNVISLSLSRCISDKSLEKIHQCILEKSQKQTIKCYFSIFGHAVTLTLASWPQNLISLSLSQDALLTKVWWISFFAYHRYHANNIMEHARTDRRHENILPPPPLAGERRKHNKYYCLKCRNNFKGHLSSSTMVSVDTVIPYDVVLAVNNMSFACTYSEILLLVYLVRLSLSSNSRSVTIV